MRSCVRVGVPFSPHEENDRITRCLFYGKAPVRPSHCRPGTHNSIPIVGCGSGHTGKRIKSFDAVIHPSKSPPHKRFLVGCRSPFMRLDEDLTALRAWCKQCLPGSVKTRRAPSRYVRDARVHGPTTAIMRYMSAHLPPTKRPDVFQHDACIFALSLKFLSLSSPRSSVPDLFLVYRCWGPTGWIKAILISGLCIPEATVSLRSVDI